MNPPLPYFGAKTRWAKILFSTLPERERINTFFDPFVGGGSMTLYAAGSDLAKSFVIGDTNEDLCNLWKAMIDEPEAMAHAYKKHWDSLSEDKSYYEQLKSEFNLRTKMTPASSTTDRFSANKSYVADPAGFLFLVMATHLYMPLYTKQGKFVSKLNPSRIPKSPKTLSKQINIASSLLSGRIQIKNQDWLDTTSTSVEGDMVFLDPPYQGTSGSVYKDNGLTKKRFEEGIAFLQERRVSMMITYDAVNNRNAYDALSDTLGLTRIFLRRQSSSHGYLTKNKALSLESFYLWPPQPKLHHQVIDKG